MRLIDANALLPLFVQKAYTIQDRHGVKIGEHWLLDYDDIKEVIDNAPTVEERPQGKWICDYRYLDCKCSICNSDALESEDYPELSPYCPNCGADLRGGADIRGGAEE